MGRGIVHVIDPMAAGGGCCGTGLLSRGAAPDIAGLACAEAIRLHSADAHVVVVLGTQAAAEHVERLGLRVHAVVPAVFGHAGLACRELRRVVIDLGGADVLQPWSARAQIACRLAAAGNGPVAEVPIETWPSFECPVGEERETVRASLGVDDNVPMVALLADPLRHADARRFVYMVGLLDVGGLPVAGVVDRRSAHVSRARRFHAEAGVGWRMLLPAEPTARLLHACDAGVIVPPSVHASLCRVERAWVRWSVLRAHLLGVPVVGAAAWLPAKAWPSDDGEVLKTRSASVTDIARQLVKVVENREKIARLSSVVCREARRVATPERFAEALDELWMRAEKRAVNSSLGVVLE